MLTTAQQTIVRNYVIADGTLNALPHTADAAWVGTAAMLAVRAAVYVHCKRSATILEKILATGTGSDASPATMDYEGTVSYLDVFNAMQW